MFWTLSNSFDAKRKKREYFGRHTFLKSETEGSCTREM